LPLLALKELFQQFHSLEVKSMSERVCGVDVHRDSLVATIMGYSLKEAGRFVNDPDSLK
jgi:hypothetical protein